MPSSLTLRSLLTVLVLVAFSGCAEETPVAGPAASSPQTDTTPVTTDAAAEEPDTDALPEGNTEPPLADVTQAVADVPAADASEAVTVNVVTPEEFQQVIAKHKGKVVFVDFWATWCVPCRKAFPHTVEFAKKHPEKLAVVSMSLDDAEVKEDVLEFLKSQDATFDNLMCSYGGADESYDAYEIPGAALPYFRIYDRDGSLKHTFGYDAENDLGVDEAQVHAALEAMIAAE